MASVMVEVGLGMAALGLAGRAASRAMPQMAKQMEGLSARVAKVNWANAKYHRGGFEAKMSRREAALILGVSPSAAAKRIAESHKRVMLLNHPDRGGSPFLAAKINEAKDLLTRKS